MQKGSERQDKSVSSASPIPRELHASWYALIRFCRELGHGEVEQIKIQDGIPVSAEVVRKKIRLA